MMFQIKLLLILVMITVTEQSTLSSKLTSNIKLHTITPSPIKSEPVTRKPNDENFEHHIFTSSKKILVKHDHAQLIDKFSLHRGFEFNCHERYLPIEFQVTGTNKDTKEEVKLILAAYLDSESNELHENQNHTSNCLKIRRYPIDTKHSIVIALNRAMDLLKNEDVEEFIFWTYVKNWQFLMLIIYQLGLYDEKNDVIKHFQGIQLLCFLYLAIKYGLKLLVKIIYFWNVWTPVIYNHILADINEAEFQRNRAHREESMENVQQNAFNTPIAPTQLPNVSNRKRN